MQQIGVVKFVQIQNGVLKQGNKPNRYYDPSFIQVVDEILLSPVGAIANTADGMQIVDIHHRDHAVSRFNGQDNGVSIGFTGHYEAMRSKFGEHVREGVAGENIIIESDHAYSLDELGQKIAFQNVVTGETFTCTITRTVAPCDEFSHFCASLDGQRLAPDVLKATLQFLDGGRRGFMIMPIENGVQPVVRAGDRVFVVHEA
jgi:hypothetical protein